MIVDVSGAGIDLKEHEEILKSSKEWHKKLRSNCKDYLGADYTGWVDLPVKDHESLICDIKKTAEEIRHRCTLFIVIGIGGSFLGAKAMIEALNGSKAGYPEVVFAGINFTSSYHEKLINRLKNESVYICVISKSGRTVEPCLMYAILKEKMIEKYGNDEARRRIIVITDETKGDLRQEVCETQMKSYVIPDDIGGRYSVLSPVGLVPISVAGHDIQKLIDGAKTMSADFCEREDDFISYTVARCAAQSIGKKVEVFEYFDHNLIGFGEWLVQLFAESEGKEGKGAFPTCLQFSRDLHSIGQFLQQGNPIFYETIIRVANKYTDITIPDYAGYPYTGKTLNQINVCAEEGVILAHKKAGTPVLSIQVDTLDEFNLGKMIYFFEMSAALSAYNLGVNPFDQPGVEAYKAEMMQNIRRLDD